PKSLFSSHAKHLESFTDFNLSLTVCSPLPIRPSPTSSLDADSHSHTRPSAAAATPTATSVSRISPLAESLTAAEAPRRLPKLLTDLSSRQRIPDPILAAEVIFFLHSHQSSPKSLV
ncbi:hypothetical protein LINPERHAP1_LOCUS25847, partial [Linum perenne]